MTFWTFMANNWHWLVLIAVAISVFSEKLDDWDSEA